MAVWTADTPYACGWSMDDDCAPCKDKFPWEDNGVPTPVQQAIFQSCVDSAAELLYALSGRQFGLCEVALRPCRKENCAPCGNSSNTPWTPMLREGTWVNLRCSTCRGSCSCPEICEVVLPARAHSVVQVRLNGEVLEQTAYRVDNGRSLVALKRLLSDEEGALPESFCWPTCQDMAAEPTEPNTWEVTYLRGKPVPAGGRRALAELACELCLACLGESCCRLPKRVTSLVTEGVTMNMLDPMDFIDKGLTGLYTVDTWLRSVNPKARARSAALLSPDSIGHRRTTWKG